MQLLDLVLGRPLATEDENAERSALHKASRSSDWTR